MKKLFFQTIVLAIFILTYSCSKSSSSNTISPPNNGTTVSTLATINLCPIEGVVVDPQGNIYVSDFFNSVIRKITPAGTATVFAGNGKAGYVDGPAGTAEFYAPIGLAIDAQGNIYVADEINSVIRKITPAGVVSTFAGNGTEGFGDGPAATAEFDTPTGVAVDAQGNVYVADLINNRIRKISTAGVVSTVAGSGAKTETDGTGASAAFSSPQGITIDGQGNLFVVDYTTIRKVTSAGVVSTIAGNSTAGFADGQGASAEFYYLTGITIDSQGNLYVCDQQNRRIRKITSSGTVTTFAGNGTAGTVNGAVANAEFSFPAGIGIDASGNLYVGDNYNLRKITVK